MRKLFVENQVNILSCCDNPNMIGLNKEYFANSAYRESIDCCYVNKDYRPTVVACLQNKSGSYLLVRSIHDSWFFPQGGIEAGEKLTDAFHRELSEELNIRRVQFKEVLNVESVGYLPGRPQRGEFTKGKRYYVCLGEHQEERINLNGAELKEGCWLAIEDMPSYTATMEPAKALLLVKAMIAVGHRINPADFHPELGEIYI